MLKYEKFRLWIAAIVVLFAAGTFGFPYLLKAVISMTMQGHPCTGGACGALGLYYGIYLKKWLLLLIALVTAYAVWRRCRSSRERILLTAYAALAVLAANKAFMVIGNFWAANFALGILGGPGVLLLVASLGPLAALLFFLSGPVENVLPPDGKISMISGPLGLPSGRVYRAFILLRVILAGSLLALALLSKLPGLGILVKQIMSLPLNIILSNKDALTVFMMIVMVVQVVTFVEIISGILAGIAVYQGASSSPSSGFPGAPQSPSGTGGSGGHAGRTENNGQDLAFPSHASACEGETQGAANLQQNKPFASSPIPVIQPRKAFGMRQ